MADGQLPAGWEYAPMTSGMLDVGDRHSIHWRSFGQVEATPVIVIHGGPGSGANLRHLTFFDPKLHRVIMFDQRGSGQSIPRGTTFANTTQHLIRDIEKLRCFLDIKRWLVFGVSWGACLALLYGQNYPQASAALVLAGLPNRHNYQNSWILEQRAQLLPKTHREFLSLLSLDERADPVAAYYRNIHSPNRWLQLEATYAVRLLEAGLKGPEPKTQTPITLDELDEDMINRAKIYLHYWAHKTFLRDGHLLVNPSVLNDVSVTLVHGDADWICPLSGAEQVAGGIEAARLIIVPGAGHSIFGKGIAHALQEVISTKT